MKQRTPQDTARTRLKGVERARNPSLSDAANISPKTMEKVTLLSNLILRFKEQEGAGSVRPRQVVPDFASHADTGFDVEPVAKSMRECSEQKSLGTHEHGTRDDTSVVARESLNSH